MRKVLCEIILNVCTKSVEGGVGRGLELTPYKIALAEHFISFIQLFNMNINYFQESLIVNN